MRFYSSVRLSFLLLPFLLPLYQISGDCMTLRGELLDCKHQGSLPTNQRQLLWAYFCFTSLNEQYAVDTHHIHSLIRSLTCIRQFTKLC